MRRIYIKGCILTKKDGDVGMHKAILVFCTLYVAFFGQQALAEFVKVRVIDRGQADGLLIQTPNNQWVVIDAGTNGKQAVAMRDWGVDKVALAVVSHRHFDHHGGMDEVIKSFPVERFIGVTQDCPGRSSDNTVRAALADNNVATLPLLTSLQTLSIDGVDFTIFPLPALQDCPHHENNNSVVIRMEYGEFSMLFTGDAEGDEIQYLVDNFPAALDVDILKASHHGSHNGYSDAFLRAVTPDKVIISAGVNGTYKHPHASSVTDYSNATDGQVYCTNRHGTLRVYGYQSGRHKVYKQFINNKSCAYDGTHY